MTFKKFLELHQVTYQGFSDVSGIPLRQVFRYAKGEALPDVKNANKIKVFTDGKVILEDWLNDDKEKPRPTLSELRSKFNRESKRNKKSV